MKLIEIARFTAKLDQMVEFYHRLLAAEPAVRSEDMAIFLVGETKLFIHKTYQPHDGDLPPENHIALAAPDVDAVCRELLAGGLRLEVAPRDYYWGRSAYLRDPDGHLIEINQSES